MKKQPDFAELFQKHFGQTPAKVTYQVRQDSNRFHDLIFLNGLIHDARFKREEVILRDARLSIPIERDCWELPHVQHSDTRGEMYIAQARLTVSPVRAIEWRFEHKTEFSSDTELWIHDMWLNRQDTQADDIMPVVVNGFTWECVLTVYEPDLKIRLQDLETPYLRSEKDRTIAWSRRRK